MGLSAEIGNIQLAQETLEKIKAEKYGEDEDEDDDEDEDEDDEQE